MKKEFVTYEIALELKELGFDEPCLAFFEINNTHQPQNLRYFLKTAVNREYIENTKILKYIYGENSLLAPLYQQVFRWFREKYKNLHGSIEQTNSYKDEYTVYIGTFGYIEGNLKDEPKVFISYEEAELECLKKLIEIVKDGKK